MPDRDKQKIPPPDKEMHLKTKPQRIPWICFPKIYCLKQDSKQQDQNTTDCGSYHYWIGMFTMFNKIKKGITKE